MHRRYDQTWLHTRRTRGMGEATTIKDLKAVLIVAFPRSPRLLAVSSTQIDRGMACSSWLWVDADQTSKSVHVTEERGNRNNFLWRAEAFSGMSVRGITREEDTRFSYNHVFGNGQHKHTSAPSTTAICAQTHPVRRACALVSIAPCLHKHP